MNVPRFLSAHATLRRSISSRRFFSPPIDPDQPGSKESVAFSVVDDAGTRVIDDVVGSELTVLLRAGICVRNL